jgi:hypothetical protein
MTVIKPLLEMVKFYQNQKSLCKNAILKTSKNILVIKKMENTNRQKLVKSLVERRKQDIRDFNLSILEWKVAGFYIGQGDIWSVIEKSPINTANELYNKFWSVFNYLLELIRFDKDAKTNTELLGQPIARMLNKFLQQTSIDLNTVENNPSFLYSEVPKHLDSWKDTQLFFDNLWEILKELKFTDDEIGVAWGVILYP